MGALAEKMLVHFPVAPRCILSEGIKVSPLTKRKTQVLSTGFTVADCDIYNFRKWAYQQENIIYKRWEDGNFQTHLLEYAGALALTDFAAVPKYFEIPLAGCVCFATQNEDDTRLGFLDGTHYVKVEAANFNDRIADFLNNIEAYQLMAM